jgi:lipopolysaccharide/colanic/teichoic acid biosynthesis glycosyltransferase
VGGFLSVEASTGADLFPREVFMKMLCLERNRAERSGRRLVLMLVESPSLLKHGNQTGATEKIQGALSRATRATDIKGWYRDGVIGVIFTEIPLDKTSVVQVLSGKVNHALRAALGAQVSEIDLSFHVFPDDSDDDDGESPGQETFSTIYPDLVGEIQSRRISLLMKRSLDILGSLLAILLLAPFMILIAVAVKLTSKGPVLFRQTRLGQSGRSFPFLKFRSMYAKADHAIHEAYIKRFISNQTDSGADGGSNKVFKLQADPRITRIGRFLRRTSLDEIPQFFCVLVGDMSLVGPRPPLPYEFEAYEIWHRRRLLAVKPGITGLWQVEGRSRVKFDEMVRMDIAYARTWSLWMDLKILWRTPRAVVGGNGAC